MTQSIELVLDDALDAAVRAEWDVLKQAGLPSMATHTDETNRPHVTLAVADEIPAPIEAELNSLADHVPMPIALGSLGLFGRRPGRVVLVRLVIPSADLLHLQSEAARLVRDLPGTGAHLDPGQWTPHVTLALSLPADRIGVTMAVLGEVPDLSGSAVAVRRWDSDVRRTWQLR